MCFLFIILLWICDLKELLVGVWDLFILRLKFDYKKKKIINKLKVLGGVICYNLFY